MELAIIELCNRFTSAPVLVQPDSSKQFILEADASDTGMGAVLHPFAFLSCHLSPVKQNYDVGSRELLAIKLGEVVAFTGGY